MRFKLKHIPCLIVLFAPLHVSADEIPALPKDSRIVSGVLPNGVKYDMVANKTQKGFADIALVRKEGPDSSNAATVLDSIPYLKGCRPWKLFSRNGSGAAPCGYVRHVPGFSVFNFRDVHLSDPAVLDSVLFALNAMFPASDSSQTLIIAGDIDIPKVVDRLSFVSLLSPAFTGGYSGAPYEWIPSSEIKTEFHLLSAGKQAGVEVRYATIRCTEKEMSTPISTVFRIMFEEMNTILKRRLESALRRQDIPFSTIEFTHIGSESQAGDETFSLKLNVASENLERATACVASVLSELDSNGVNLYEFNLARSVFRTYVREYSERIYEDNADFVERCINNCLYGASLASKRTKADYMRSNNVSEETSLSLFNGFNSSYLDSTDNLTLSFSSADMNTDVDRLVSAFAEGWANPLPPQAKENARLTLPRSGSAPLKLRSETKDKISGGWFWTFSNGMKVIYRETAGNGHFDYSFMTRGGTVTFPGVCKGEGAFFSDMVKICRVAGVEYGTFSDSLARRGIDIKVEAGRSDMRIGGSAPNDELETVISSILAISEIDAPDSSDFDWYRRRAALMDEVRYAGTNGINSFLDSLSRPMMIHSDVKLSSNLTVQTPLKAVGFVKSHYENMADGVIVLQGKFDRESLKKALCKFLGAFKTSARISGVPGVNEPVLSAGTITNMQESCQGLWNESGTGADFELVCEMPFTKANNYALKLAELFVKKRLAGYLAEFGNWSVVSSGFRMYPEESASMFINVRPCSPDGLARGITPAPGIDALNALRKFIEAMPEMEISDNELSSMKETLISLSQESWKNPDTVMDAILMRYSFGKDTVANFETVVRSISADDVREILSSLVRGGCVVEHVTL